MDSKTQRFKFSLPIIKTRTEIHKDEDGNEKEIKFVEGIASSTDKDLHGDKMAPSAIQSMADSLKLHVISLNDEHNTSWQSELGEITKLDVTKENKLRIEARLNEMSKSNDLWYALTDLNKKLGLSIGGYVKEYEMEKDESSDEATWIRVYKDIELDHIAVTSRPANPKTWVSVISKSIETSEEDLKKVAKRVPATYNKEQNLKELAHKIVRSIQDMEGDLLLELAYTGLTFLNEEQLNLVERNLPMDKNKKDVSLEAEEAKIKADSDVQPEDEKDETPATPENESSEDESKVEEESDEEAEEAEATDAEATDEAEEESTEKSEDDESEEEEAEASGEENEAEAEESADETDESEDDSGKEETTDESEEDAEEVDSEESEEESEEKSEEIDGDQLLKMVSGLAKSLEVMVKTNKKLSEDVKELSSQPANRKTVEIKKVVGDDDSEEVDTASLIKERDEKISELKKANATNPALFSMIQRTRSEYASKIQQSE